MHWIELGRLSVARGGSGLAGFKDRLSGRSPGQSTVEYALVGALVVIAAASALTLLGGELTTVFTNISHTLASSSASH